MRLTSAGSKRSLTSMEEILNQMKPVRPHGGKLINREVTGPERQRLIDESLGLSRLQLNARAMSDLLLIATGAYSPLEGFLDGRNYRSVLRRMRLADGIAWPMPITLAVS